MRWIKSVLILGLVELVHFLAFSALVGWLGKWKLRNVTDSFDLIAWVWVGMTEFWVGGVGTWIMAVCAAAMIAVILERFVQWLALARRRSELEVVLRRKEEELRITLHEEITRQVIAEQDAREQSLNVYKEHLNQGLREISIREADAEALQRDVSQWKEELQAIRKKMEKLKEKRGRVRESAKAALDALDRVPLNVPEARRHLMRMVRDKK